MTNKKRWELIRKVLEAKKKSLSKVLDCTPEESEYYTANLYAWSEINGVLMYLDNEELLNHAVEIWVKGEQK